MKFIHSGFRAALTITMAAGLWLGALFYADIAEAQLPAAGSTVGNQASATFLDSAGTLRTATSNTVQTTIGTVRSFTLSTAPPRTSPEGTQVCFSHTITNTGNAVTSYTLNPGTTGGAFALTMLAYFPDSNQDGVPDTGMPITAPISLAAGATFIFVECGTTPTFPIGTTPTMPGTVTFSVTDNNAPTPTTLTVTDSVTITLPHIAFNKSLLNAPPPGGASVAGGASPNAGPLYVVLNYTNSGTANAINATFTDILPPGMIYVPGSGRWSGSGMTPLTDMAAGDPVGINYTAPTTAINGTITAVVASVGNSTSGQLYFQVTIAPNLAVTVNGVNSALTTNQATVTWVDPNDMMVKGPNTSNPVVYTVLQTAGVSANGSTTATGTTAAEPVTVASAPLGSTIQFTDVLWNTGNGADTIDVTLLNTALNGVGCNPASTAVNACTFPAGTTFQIFATGGTTSLLDSNGNGTPDTGVIPQPVAGVCAAPYITSADMTRCGYPIVLAATIPMGATPGNNGGAGYRVLIQGTSALNPMVLDTVPNVLTTIGANNADITNNGAVGGGGVLGTGATGTTIVVTNAVTPAPATPTTTTFTLYANNTGGAAAIYDLSAAFVAVPGAPAPATGVVTPPVGWSVQFFEAGGPTCATTTGSPITSTGTTPIPPGGSKLYCAVVTVPPISSASAGVPTRSPAGNYGIDFTITQQGNPSVSDVIRDQVTVLPVHNVSLAPNGAQTTAPGGAVTYVHTLTNSGNVAEPIAFPTALTNSQPGWTSIAYVDTNNNGVLDVGVDTPITPSTTPVVTVMPNGTQTIFVRVSAPTTLGSPPNQTGLSATYNGGASITNSVTDTTTVNDGPRVEKYQQSPGGIGSCTSTPTPVLPGAWSNMVIPQSAATQPGRCIAYLIVVTNATASDILGMNISDQVPANTRLETGCGAPTVTGPGMTLGAAYATGFTGVVAVTSAATAVLPPNGTVTLQFCVKINS